MLKALAPWFGSKRGMAPTIIEQLGPHRYYFEPFCGSLAVLLSKPSCYHEIVCDLHGELINLARTIQSDEGSVELFGRLARTMYAEEIFRDATEQLSSDDLAPVDRAYWFFVHSWMCMSGIGGSNQAGRDRKVPMATRWTQNGGPSATRFRNALVSIPEWYARLHNVQILNRDAFEVLPKISDDPGVALYIDPPYPPETLSGTARYDHDFKATDDVYGQMTLCKDMDLDDHTRLANELRRFKNARVVLSCYECERYRQLYDGWTFIDCQRLKSLTNIGKRGARRSVAMEVLIVNGEKL